MAQHDYVISNAGGAVVRADINEALQAILSSNSGASAPTVTKPYMMWFDTTAVALKIRNAADTAWVLYSDFVLPPDGTVTAAKLASGAAVANIGTGGISATELASNAVTTAKLSNAAVTPAKLSQPFTQGTAVATTSGTAIDFTSIPSWVKRITVLMTSMSTNGSGNVEVRLGSGSIQATSYLGSGSVTTNGAAPSVILSTTGFLVFFDAATVSNQVLMTLTLVGSNTWVCAYTGSRNSVATIMWGAGSVTLSGVLDRLRIATVNGTDTFDAGSINILYE